MGYSTEQVGVDDSADQPMAAKGAEVNQPEQPTCDLGRGLLLS
jgi:hypothetical protein